MKHFCKKIIDSNKPMFCVEFQQAKTRAYLLPTISVVNTYGLHIEIDFLVWKIRILYNYLPF